MVWNRREYRKKPDTEKRVARPNDHDHWVVREQPKLRIVSDALWTAVKKRQLEVQQSFSNTTTNRLNAAHRPQYLLSGILECAHCCGPYAIMAEDRYGCTDRQKKLPIDHLGGIVCTNSKTISRFELEERVVSAMPDNLLGAHNLDRINRDIKTAVARGQQRAVVEPERLRTEITAIETKQKSIGEKIAERIMVGHAVIPALDQMLNDLEQQRLSLAGQLAAAPSKSAHAETPAKPGLLRVAEEEGRCVDVEIWGLRSGAFGDFVAAIPSPLGVGTVQLADGQTAKGFLVESIALAGAWDISGFGGWRAFVQSQDGTGFAAAAR